MTLVLDALMDRAINFLGAPKGISSPLWRHKTRGR